MEKELIYWEENGVVKQNNELAEQILKQIQDLTPLKEFEGTENEYGFMLYSVFSIDGIDGLIIKAVWYPAFGYSWQETRIYKIPLKEDC
jgi:MFS-type transporter involved in bile tolerance (Atg22 family)